MRKFLLDILLFTLPILLLTIPLDLMLSNLLKRSHEYPGEFEVMNDIYNSCIDAEVAVYGSSRAWVNIDPAILTDSLKISAYNFGIDGQNFTMQYLRHLELLKFNKKPELIILSVDPFSIEEKRNLYQADQFLPYMLWNDNIKKYTNDYNAFDQLDYLVPLIRFSGKYDAFKTCVKTIINQNSSRPYRNRGFAGMNREWNLDLENAQKASKKYKILLDTNCIVLLEEFIEECRESEIQLILIYTPEYIEGQNFIENRQSLIDIYKNLSAKNNLIFIDYSEDTICKNKTFFYNTNHLNKTGAEIFSKKLSHDLIKLKKPSKYSAKSKVPM